MKPPPAEPVALAQGIKSACYAGESLLSSQVTPQYFGPFAEYQAFLFCFTLILQCAAQPRSSLLGNFALKSREALTELKLAAWYVGTHRSHLITFNTNHGPNRAI